MIKDLLVHVDDTARADARIDLAVVVARRFGAHLVGLYATDPQTWMPYVGFEGGTQILAMLEETEAKRRDAAQAKFAERTAGTLLQTEWRSVRGWPAARLAAHARYADLLVLGQAGFDDANPGELQPGDVIMGSGRPALIVPAVGRYDTVGSRPLVAWDGSREAARAVADAMPFLAAAELVHVMTIAAPGGDESDADPVMLAAHLARHGVRAEAARETADDISVGDLLLSRAADLSIDLVVMGGYAHSRLRELVLGGATRSLLGHMTVPVLMSH